MKILQINTVVNSGSTGRIAEGIGLEVISRGHESYIAYGRNDRPSTSNLIKIGNKKDVYYHGIKTLLFDKHGLGSIKATKTLIKEMNHIMPDVIHLHNLHGYYLNYEILFEFIKSKNIPIVWTFHDCWPFTGHCAFFDSVDCKRWKIHCEKCPLSTEYPRSFFDRSYNNFRDKKEAFLNVENLIIVTPSNWLKNLVLQSFLKNYTVKTINNGIDLDCFYPSKKKKNQKLILGVASTWSKRKGLHDFFKLRDALSDDIKIVLIGLSQTQIKSLPQNILGISKTESIEELARWYQKATVFVNPTYSDNFPTTNLEALACGTPVITYNTGGSPESLNSEVGTVVNKGDISSLNVAIDKYINLADLEELKDKCRSHAVKFYDKYNRFSDYYDLYQKMID